MDEFLKQLCVYRTKTGEPPGVCARRSQITSVCVCVCGLFGSNTLRLLCVFIG